MKTWQIPVMAAAVAMCVALTMSGCGGGSDEGSDSGGTEQLTFQPLEFPFSNPSDIVSMDSFGIPNWSGTEPHNGIDLIINESLESSQIISPTAGEVVRIEAHENSYSHPPGQMLLTVSVKVNEEWTVDLVIEPGCVDEATKAAQFAAVQVTVGQEVAVGTPVARLLTGDLGHSHLHYMVSQNNEAVCAFANSSASAQAVFETIAQANRSGLPDGNICYGNP